MISYAAARWPLAWGLLTLAGCVDSRVAPWPESPSPTGSLIFARRCGPELFVLAFDAEATAAALPAEPCAGEQAQAIAYFEAPLAELGYDAGPMRTTPCPTTLGNRCRALPLPSPGPDRLFSWAPESNDTSGTWAPTEDWPDALRELRFPRRNRCPVTRDRSVLSQTYQKLQADFIDAERLVIMAEPPPDALGAYEVHLYETKLEELLERGLPDTPNRGTFPSRGLSVQAAADGTIFVGLGSPPAILVVSPDGAQRLEAHPWPERAPMRLALRPGTEDAPELAVRDVHFSAEIHRFGRSGWEHLNEVNQMTGYCFNERGSGQKASMVWKDHDELLVLPNATEDRTSSRSSSVAPDGYWHVIAGQARWERVDARAPGDCLMRLLFVPGTGVLAITQGSRFYARSKDRWRPLEPDGFELGVFDGRINDAVSVAHGFAYTREGRRFGLVVDEVLCEEAVLDNTDLNGIVGAGHRLVVLGDAEREDGTGRLLTPSSIHVIALETPP